MSVEKKHFVDINLQGNKLVNPTLGANADLTKAGSFGFSNGRVKYYDGTTAQDVANLNDLETLHDTITGEITAGFVSALKFQGAYDPTTGTLEAPVAGSVAAGSVYVVSVADTFFTEAVTVGDTLIAKVGDPATLADWIIVQSNLDLATTTTVGSVRMATSTDIDNSVSGAVAVTPAQLTSTRNDIVQLIEFNNDEMTAAVQAEIADRIADVNAEETRALAAEATLTTNLNAEITRATTAEGVIAANLAQEILDRTADVNAEETRALAAEAALQAEIDALEALSGTGLADEIARATAAEAAIAADLAQEILDRVADVNAEETRALAAEGVIAANLAQEILDRTADVNAEETRALAAEAALQAEIDAEEVARAAAIAQEVIDRNAAIAAEKTTVTVLTADWTLVSGVYEVEITHGLSASMVMFSFIAAGVGVEFGYEQLTSTTAKIYSNVTPPATMTVLAHKIA